MPPRVASVFDLPDRLIAKADHALIAADEQHFAAIATSLDETLADLTNRLDAARRAPGGTGQRALDRDQEVHRLTARRRALSRFGLDLCLGRMVGTDNAEPGYVGRLGLTDGDGRRLLVDWRSPAAEPFFGATHANPMGLSSRRRYRWTRGRITDYWDEVFAPDALPGNAALDDQSAFIASLGGSRSATMRDVLSTIQADQDAIIRAGSRGALVVDGGPGTGKTVVALHRTAYLLHRDPRLDKRHGGVLFVGPHEPYLAYVADVLPNLGEEDVQTCTLRDLLPQGSTAQDDADPDVARLKSSVDMVAAIEAAVRFYEEPPTTGLTVTTEEADIQLTAADWARAFDAPTPGIAHNDAREEVWEELVTLLAERIGGDEADLRHNLQLRSAVNRAWPLIDAADLVADLWSVPAYLRRCAPWLSPADVSRLQRADPRAWTVADLPLLDAARHRLGDPLAAQQRHRHEAALAAERRRMAQVVDDLLIAEDSREPMLNLQRDVQAAVVDDTAPVRTDLDRLAGPFGHVVVDEAQELTDAQWQMLLRRCPSRSLTVVGDRAQARHGFAETWTQRLHRIGLDRVELAPLTINYRTPAEIMAEAAPVIRAVLPDANVPTSIRHSGIPVMHAAPTDLHAIVDRWLATHPEGLACVIGDPSFTPTPRVRSLSPELVKGLEFDLVVMVEPKRFGDGMEGSVDRYVAMTRATRQLAILEAADDVIATTPAPCSPPRAQRPGPS